jgi:hypothetical protein
VTGTLQNTTGSIPVTALDPPPEGTMATKLSFALTPVEPAANATLQLSSQGGLQMSQVVTLSIDNSNNQYAISVTHGVFNENVIVPAFGAVIVPTFSARGGSYSLLVAADVPSNGLLTTILNVDIICMNYSRTPGSFGATNILSIIGGSGQNTTNLVNMGVISPVNTQVTLRGSGNYILDSLDFFIEGIDAIAAGTFQLDWTIYAAFGGLPNQPICSGFIIGTATAAGWISGAAITSAVSRTWVLGFGVQRNNSIVLDISPVNPAINIDAIYFRANISGVSTP